MKEAENNYDSEQSDHLSETHLHDNNDHASYNAYLQKRLHQEEIAHKQHERLTNTSYRKLYWQNSLPNIIASFYNQVMNALMLVVLSQKDPELVSAYGFCTCINLYLSAIALLIGRGVNNAVSYFFGQDKEEAAESALMNGVYTCFILSGINIAILYPLLKYIIPVLGTPKHLVAHAIQYSKIQICCSSVMSLAAVTNGCLRAQGFPIYVLYGMVMSSTIGLILAYILCSVCNLGIAGYAIAWVSNPAILTVSNACFMQFLNRIPLKFGLYKPSKIIFSICAKGASSALNTIAGMIQGIIMNEGIVYRASTNEVERIAAARANVNSITNVIMTTCMTLAMNATLPLANFTRGAGMYTRFRQINLYGLKVTAGIMFGLCVIVLCLSPVLPYIYYSKTEKEELATMRKLLQIFLCGRAFAGPSLSVIELIQSTGRNTAATLMGMVRNLIIISPIMLIILYSNKSVWMFLGGFPIGDICSFLVTVTIIICFRKKLWLSKSAAAAKEEEHKRLKQQEDVLTIIAEEDK